MKSDNLRFPTAERAEIGMDMYLMQGSVKSPHWTRREVEELTRLYLEGRPQKEIAKAIGRPYRATGYRIQKLGLPARRRLAHDAPLHEVPEGIKRTCLMCSHDFISEGDHNRICKQCKSTERWKTA